MVEENPSTHTRSLANRIGRNLSASFVARFSSSLHRVAIAPLFIWFLGPPRYGEWLVLSAIPSWLSLSNISLGSVAGNAIALRVAEGRLVDARRAYSSALAAITGLSLCGLGIVFAAACYFAVAPIATGGGGLSADSLTAILLLSASIFVSFFFCLIVTIFQELKVDPKALIPLMRDPLFNLYSSSVSRAIRSANIAFDRRVFISHFFRTVLCGDPELNVNVASIAADFLSKTCVPGSFVASKQAALELVDCLETLPVEMEVIACPTGKDETRFSKEGSLI